MRGRFVVTRRPGPAWDPAKPTRTQGGWDAHAAVMDAFAHERFVAFGGPAGDHNKVVLIVDAPDGATIQARLARDPWTLSGLLHIEYIEPWALWLPPRPDTAALARRGSARQLRREARRDGPR